MIRILARPGPFTITVGSAAYLSTTSWPPYTMARSADRMISSAPPWSVGRYTASSGRNPAWRKALTSRCAGQGLAPRRAHRDPVAQRERLGPQAVHARAVSGGVHGEHLAAPRPHRTAVAGALLAPVEGRADRPGRPHRIECRGNGVGHAAGSGAGDRDRQPRNPAGQFDIGRRSPVRR